MILSHDAGALLLQAVVRDTIYVAAEARGRDWFEILTGAASIAISIALLALAVGLIPAAWNFRKSYKKANELLDKVYADITPLVRHAHAVADNLDYITTAVRSDLQKLSRSIDGANARLQQVAKESETRLAEFNALLKVMQEEAEDVFVSTASAVRGVREGASSFGDALEAPPERARLTMDRLAALEALAAAGAPMPLADDDVDEVDDDGDWDGDDDDFDDGEPGHGPGAEPEGERRDEPGIAPGQPPRSGPERPRIRTRYRRG